MNDYISKQAAIIEMMDNDVDHAHGTDGREVVQILLDIPAADVRENVHGEWIDTGSGQKCSVCREIQYGYDNYRHFCAACGAVMDGSKSGYERG